MMQGELSKKVLVIVLGGTITYMHGNRGNRTASDLFSDIATNRALSHVLVECEDFLAKASSALLMSDLFSVAQRVVAASRQGYTGIVVVQGTDTIEETAYLLDLIAGDNIPIAVTGAMRSPELPGYEGVANILASICTVSSDEFHDMGCVVVLNDEIHAARYVRKDDTQNVSTFRSQFGPIGLVAEGTPHLFSQPVRRSLKLGNGADPLSEEPADIYTSYLSAGETGKVLPLLPGLGYKGIVMAGMGGGHVTAEYASYIDKLPDDYPKVLSTRSSQGMILESTYSGYPGSEVALIDKGAIPSGILSPAKARVLLCLLITSHMCMSQIREIFNLLAH